MNAVLRPRDQAAVIDALRAGVVPRVGVQHIQVGREKELRTLIADIDRIADGGSTFRLVIGEYGAGKTFFINLVRSVAAQKSLVTLAADLNPDRRLHGANGQAKSLYTELMRSAATRARPDGGALSGIVEKFLAHAKTQAETRGVSAQVVIREKLASLTELVGGFDFADVIAAYCDAAEAGDNDRITAVQRWLRGEFSTRTDARAALGVRGHIEDDQIYDHLKLFARFVRLAGYGGVLVCIDELVNLYKLNHAQSRASNYEQLLRMLNDSLQGTAEGLGFVFGGTPESLADPRRGLYSYAALQTRLAENSFAKDGLSDFSGPVVRLASLTPEDFFVLLQKIRAVVAHGKASAELISDAHIEAFMSHCLSRIGEAYFRTPRTTIKAFIDLLAIVQQNENVDLSALIGHVAVERDEGASRERAVTDPASGDEFAEFRL